MKEILIPENFDGQKYFDKYGDYPTSERDGYLTVPDEILSVDDCVTTQEEIQNHYIGLLWKSASDYAIEAVDIDARSKYLAMLIDTEVSAAKKQLIKDIYTWMDSIWVEYYTRKSLVLAGDLSVSIDFSSFGNPPYSFSEVVM